MIPEQHRNRRASGLGASLVLTALLVVVASGGGSAGLPQKRKPSGRSKATAVQPKPAPTPAPPAWPQWGGPNRNFTVEGSNVAESWPSTGPRQLWKRELGEGHSSIVIEQGRLYSMYRPVSWLSLVRRSKEEVVIALDAATGRTVWEYRFESPTEGLDFEHGSGPHSTPLLVGNRLFAVGSTAKFFALDKQSGRVLWSHDLVKEYQADRMNRGYSCSPIAYQNTVVLMTGGRGHAVMAFNQHDGSVAWMKQDFANSYASPILINVDGQDQLVAFMADEIAGLDPNNGELLWRHPHKTDWGLNISTPVWGEGNLLFCSSAYNNGSRVLQLNQKGGKTSTKELWFNNRVRVHIGTVIRVGDFVYGSSGDFGPAFLTAVDVRTGKEAWRDRSFSKATFVYANEKFVLLDEDGNLALVKAGPSGMQVRSKVSLLKNEAWTPPTLVGSRLYLRDRKTVVALDLS